MIEFIQKHIVLVLCGWGFVFAWMFWANARPYKPPKKFSEQWRINLKTKEENKKKTKLKHNNL